MMKFRVLEEGAWAAESTQKLKQCVSCERDRIYFDLLRKS